MVMKNKRRASRESIDIDFTDVEGGGRSVPDGQYVVEVLKGSREEGQESGKEYIKWEYKVSEGKYKGTKLYDTTSLQPQALWKLHSFITAHGGDAPEGVVQFVIADYIGKEFTVQVTNEEYEGKDRPKVTGYVNPEVAADDDETEEEEETEEEDTEEEEEEEEPTPKAKGKRAQARAAAKKSVKDEEEDEEDEEDEEEEETEEEEPPVKSSKKKSSSSASKFKKGDRVKFKEDGKIYKGKILEVDGSVATVDVNGDEWQVQSEDLSSV